MKYKIGDMVTIVDKYPSGCNTVATHHMISQYAGQTFAIKNIDEFDGQREYLLVGVPYVWDEFTFTLGCRDSIKSIDIDKLITF